VCRAASHLTLLGLHSLPWQARPLPA
jgi:hypothetical protein